MGRLEVPAKKLRSHQFLFFTCPMEKQKQEYLQSAQRANLDDFVQLVKKFKSKNDSFNIVELFQMFSRKESENFWSSLEMLLLKKLTAESSPEDIVSIESSDNGKNLIACIITAAQIFIKEKSRVAPAALLNIAKLLHDQMLNFDELSTTIASLCEDWYLQERDGRDSLVPSTLTYLLVKSIHSGAKPADVKRVWGLRNGLRLLDLQDESAVTLKRLLLACLIHPLYLRTADGRKFIGFLFSLYHPFVRDLHLTIKTQIPTCRKSMLEAYGEIYFKAWKNATGPFLVEIEYKCIQDLMHDAVHVSNATLAQNLRRVLNAFHEQKKQRGVDEMLLRLYEPILWRSLSVANAQVRKQSAALLVAAFPLQNPEAPQRETDELMQTQFEKLQALLNDDDINVRVVAVEGTSKILGTYWELIPVATQQVLLTKMVGDLAFDASSGNVRAAVLDGVRFVLDNHLSHTLLKGLLPSLSNLIHDKIEKVRVAMCEILLYVKSIREIKFYSIVSIEHLLARLGSAGETSGVCKRITQLLLSSFFPVKESASEQVKRCLVLLQTNAAAAKPFYAFVSEWAPVNVLVKFIAALHKALLTKSVPEKENASSEQNHFASSSSSSSSMIIQDAKLVEGILQSMSSVWVSLSGALKTKENEPLKTFLENTFNDAAMAHLSTLMKTSAATVCVLQIASLLPESVLPSLSANIFDQLTTLSNLSTEQEQQQPLMLLRCLFAWNRGVQVLDLLASAIESGGGGPNQEGSSAALPDKAKKRRRPKNAPEPILSNNNNSASDGLLLKKLPSPIVAMKLLSVLFSDSQLRTATLSANVSAALDRIRVALMQKWFPYAVPAAAAAAAAAEGLAVVQLCALETFSRLMLHRAAADLHDNSDDDAATTAAAIAQLQSFVDWFPATMLPRAKTASLSESDQKFVSVSAAVCGEMIACGFCTSTQKGDPATPQTLKLRDSICANFTALLNSSNDNVIRIAVPIVCKAVFCFCANETESESADDDLKLATDLLELAVRRSPSSKSGNAADPKSLSADQSIKICLGEVISLSQRHISTKFVLERIFDPIFCEISVPETFPSNLAESIDELPDKVALVLDRVSRSNAGISALTSHMSTYLTTHRGDALLPAAWKVLEIVSALKRNGNSAEKKKSIDQKALNECLHQIVTATSAASSSLGNSNNVTVDEHSLNAAMIKSAAEKLLLPAA